MKKKLTCEAQTDLFTFDKAAVFQEKREAKERVERIQEGVDAVQDGKGPRFDVRVHPFDKHGDYARIGLTLSETDKYILKIRAWLEKKSLRPVHILIEHNQVAWALWSLEGKQWEYEALH